MKNYIWPVVSLLAAAGLQGNLPPAVSLWGAKPDLILVVLIAYSLAADLTFATTLGFVAGVIHGAAAGLAVGSFIVTRCITGFLAGLVTSRLFSENPIVPVLSAAWLTLVAEGLFLLANPRAGLVPAAGQIAGECVLNALLTLVLYWVMRNLETRRKLRLVNARL